MASAASRVDDERNGHDSAQSHQEKRWLRITDFSSSKSQEHDAHPFKLPMVAEAGGLFSLPVELRLQIYSLICCSSAGVKEGDLAIVSMRMDSTGFRNLGRAKNLMWRRACGTRSWICVDLLCVSQQVYMEALKGYRSITMFTVAVEQGLRESEDRRLYRELSPQFGAHLRHLSLGVELRLGTAQQNDAVSSIQQLSGLVCNQTLLRILNVRVEVFIMDQLRQLSSEHDLHPRQQSCDSIIRLLDAFKGLPCSGRLAVACRPETVHYFGKGIARTVFRNIGGREGHLRTSRCFEICEDE